MHNDTYFTRIYVPHYQSNSASNCSNPTNSDSVIYIFCIVTNLEHIQSTEQHIHNFHDFYKNHVQGAEKNKEFH